MYILGRLCRALIGELLQIIDKIVEQNRIGFKLNKQGQEFEAHGRGLSQNCSGEGMNEEKSYSI
jgi:hypothetical protein